MKVAKQKTPYGYTIFCDDIRPEINGKFSLVGIYSSILSVHKPLPVMMPKFAFHISYFERPGESNEAVKVSIFAPGNPDDEPIWSADLPTEMARNLPAPPEGKFKDPVLTFRIPVVLAPLVLNEEGPLRVRAYRGDLEIKLGTLMIENASGNETESKPSS